MSLDLSLPSSQDQTLDLCTFLTTLKYANLPADLIHAAKASILNSLGCGLSSSPHSLPAALKLYKALDPLSKSPRVATVLGMRERVTVDDAAMLNGMAMTARFYDDTHLPTLAHPSGPPLAAILALADVQRVNGEDAILAFIVGVETGLAIAKALGLTPYRKGWHMTSIVGSFAAAAAVSKLMNLSALAMAIALGHASSMTSGSRNVFATDTLIMHSGRAAQNGILAARLAREGFGSTTHAVEKWIRLFSLGDEGGDPRKINEMLQDDRDGKHKWALLENALKPYPCGIVIHPLIDAGIQAHAYFFPENNGPSSVPLDGKSPQEALDIITKIEASVSPMTIRLCGVQQPKKFMDIIFSSHHGLAVGLVYGKGSIHEYSEPVANDPLIVELRDRIALVPDESLKDDQTKVKFRYISHDGREQTKEIWIEHATGSLENPMTDEQLTVKFEDQAVVGGLSQRNIHECLSQCWEMEKVDNLGSFMRWLVPELGS